MYKILIHDRDSGETKEFTGVTSRVASSKDSGSATNEFSLSCLGIEGDYIYDEIEIFKDGDKKHGGIIINQRDVEQQGVKRTNFKCLDYSFLMVKRLVSDVYSIEDSTGGEAMAIIKDVVSKAVPEITTNNVSTDNTVIVGVGETISFTYQKVFDVINTVLDHLEDRWFWYIDEDLDLHVFNTFERVGNTFEKDLATGEYNFRRNSLSLEYEAYQGANRVWVIGDYNALGTPIEQTFTGDGDNRFFNLSYVPNNLNVFEDGVSKTVSDVRDSGADYYIDAKNKVVQALSSPGVNVKIKTAYNPLRQVITKRENPLSIRKHGPIEVAIKNKDVTTSLNARRIAAAELKKRSINRRLVTLQTQEEVNLGDKCTMNIDDSTWLIQGEFYVTQVSLEDTPNKPTYYTVNMMEILE